MGKPWPEEWSIQPIMGLTDRKGKTIYIADGLSESDRHETLIHEFLHMEKHDVHGVDFYRDEAKLLRKAAKLRIRWAPPDD